MGHRLEREPLALRESQAAGGETLRLRELFFLSFGGQAPLISLLTFGTAMLALAGRAGSEAMLMATAIVAMNGLVVYFMSRRFKQGGGYYRYAYYSLTPNLGLNTGWTYLAYSLAYGGTLLSGGAYVMKVALSLLGLAAPDWALAVIVSSASAGLLLAGLKVSARYAELVAAAEAAIIVALSLALLRASGWHLYNPVETPLRPYLFAAVVLGLGIPTGYGSIVPLGYDARSSDIGRAAVIVSLFGGLLAAAFFYSLGAAGFTGNLVEYLLHRFGAVGLVLISVIALSDGAMGGIAYMLASSRTALAMSEDGLLPQVLSRRVRGRPLASEAFAASLFVATITMMSKYLGLYLTFASLGSLAGLFNLFIHSSADFSLIRVALRRAARHVHEVLTGAAAAAVSLYVLLYSLPAINKYVAYIFMGWIILGFLYAEALEMVGRPAGAPQPGGPTGGRSMRLRAHRRRPRP